MDQVVYVDKKANEMQRLLDGEKNMLIRGANGRKLPYNRVHAGDCLYLINNNAEGEAKAKAIVKRVVQSEKMTEEESRQMLAAYQSGLQLTPAQKKRWDGKKYLIIIALDQIQAIDPIKIDKSNYSNMDDWLQVEDINTVIIK
ncbi:MAG: hypothetical protein JEZ00_17745 [Anaerolineaceae bacterium]|nr:hypothetical protein [Anaerolineaceae bacterium]